MQGFVFLRALLGTTASGRFFAFALMVLAFMGLGPGARALAQTAYPPLAGDTPPPPPAVKDIDLSASPCYQYTTPEQKPKGYGSPVSYFGNGTLIKGRCSGNQLTVLAGGGNDRVYVYENAFYWDGGAWRKVRLSGPKKKGVWLYRGASAKFTMPMPTTYFVAYTCEWVNGAWKCGCTDPSCDSRQWQIQKFSSPSVAPGSVPPAPPKRASSYFVPFPVGKKLVLAPDTPLSNLGVTPGDFFEAWRQGQDPDEVKFVRLNNFPVGRTLFSQGGKKWNPSATLRTLGFKHPLVIERDKKTGLVVLTLGGKVALSKMVTASDDPRRSGDYSRKFSIPRISPRYSDMAARYGSYFLAVMMEKNFKWRLKNNRPTGFTTRLMAFEWDGLLPGQSLILKGETKLRDLGLQDREDMAQFVSMNRGTLFSSLEDLGVLDAYGKIKESATLRDLGVERMEVGRLDDGSGDFKVSISFDRVRAFSDGPTSFREAGGGSFLDSALEKGREGVTFVSDAASEGAAAAGEKGKMVLEVVGDNLKELWGKVTGLVSQDAVPASKGKKDAASAGAKAGAQGGEVVAVNWSNAALKTGAVIAGGMVAGPVGAVAALGTVGAYEWMSDEEKGNANANTKDKSFIERVGEGVRSFFSDLSDTVAVGFADAASFAEDYFGSNSDDFWDDSVDYVDSEGNEVDAGDYWGE